MRASTGLPFPAWLEACALASVLRDQGDMVAGPGTRARFRSSNDSNARFDT